MKLLMIPSDSSKIPALEIPVYLVQTELHTSIERSFVVKMMLCCLSIL